MLMNKFCLTFVYKNVFYDHVRVFKGHTSYVGLDDDLGFVAAFYSDSGCENEDDDKVSIDSQSESSNTLKTSELLEALTLNLGSAIPPRPLRIFFAHEPSLQSLHIYIYIYSKKKSLQSLFYQFFYIV